MSERRFRDLRGVVFSALVLAGVTLSGSALARHTEKEHIVTDTAWTLEGGKNWHVGLFDANVTLADRFSIGTYTLPGFARTPSLHLKWQYISWGPVHFAAQLGIVRLDTSTFDKKQRNAPVFTVTTGTFSNSLELGSRHQLSNNLVITAVQAEGAVDNDTLRGAGEGALTNIQYVGAYEYRASRTLAIVVTGRYQLFTLVAARVNYTLEPDQFTTIDVAAEASDDTILNFEYAFSIVPSLNWSWDTFNLRLGLGYGNFNVPGVNFMVNRRSLIPELDLFWRF